MAEQQTIRTATPTRWAQALDRAADLAAYTLDGDARHWAVTSGSCAGVAYTVTVAPGQPPTCGCKAGEYDAVCRHRALVLDKLGMLPRVVEAAPVVALADRQARKAAALAALYGDDVA